MQASLKRSLTDWFVDDDVPGVLVDLHRFEKMHWMHDERSNHEPANLLAQNVSLLLELHCPDLLDGKGVTYGSVSTLP